jgi:(1->4)-alpha-D-glucan 1-alpha-D-glucosylmutase
MREAQIASRSRDRAQLLLALERCGLLPAGSVHDLAALPALTAALNAGAHAYLASSPAKLMVVQLEDAVLALEQVNLPGTTDQYPNWRKKLPVALERLSDDPGVSALVAALGRVRNLA